jgi:hypothetical protein
MIDAFHIIGNKLAWLIGNGQRARVGTEPWKKGQNAPKLSQG